MDQLGALACRLPATFTARDELRASFCERVADLLDRIDYRLARSEADREEIFRLRYQAYLREGAISPSSAETFFDPYDDTKNAWLFGVHLDGELASSIRIHVASREEPRSPSLEVFSDYLQRDLNAGKVIVDSTRFVTSAKLSRVHRGLPYVTLRLCWLAVRYFNAYHFLAAVRREHQAFYQRTFGHRPLCLARAYPLLAKPISLMTVHYPAVADEVHCRYPFFRSTTFERRILFS